MSLTAPLLQGHSHEGVPDFKLGWRRCWTNVAMTKCLNEGDGGEAAVTTVAMKMHLMKAMMAESLCGRSHEYTLE